MTVSKKTFYIGLVVGLLYWATVTIIMLQFDYDYRNNAEFALMHLFVIYLSGCIFGVLFMEDYDLSYGRAYKYKKNKRGYRDFDILDYKLTGIIIYLTISELLFLMTVLISSAYYPRWLV